MVITPRDNYINILIYNLSNLFSKITYPFPRHKNLYQGGLAPKTGWTCEAELGDFRTYHY